MVARFTDFRRLPFFICVERFPVRGWHPIFHGATDSRKHIPNVSYQRSANEVEVFSPCGAVLIREIVFPSPVDRDCRGMEEFLNYGWNPFLPARCSGGSMALWLECSCSALT